MYIAQENNKNAFKISKFLDFDKREKVFYNNLYFDNQKFVVKMPLAKKEQTTKVRKDIKIEKFDLTKYTYILSYD